MAITAIVIMSMTIEFGCKKYQSGGVKPYCALGYAANFHQ
jgi:hypothetical protein